MITKIHSFSKYLRKISKITVEPTYYNNFSLGSLKIKELVGEGLEAYGNAYQKDKIKERSRRKIGLNE